MNIAQTHNFIEKLYNKVDFSIAENFLKYYELWNLKWYCFIELYISNEKHKFALK